MGEKLSNNSSDQTAVFSGGPVDMQRGFVIHQPIGNWESTMPITDQVGVTTSNDIITALAKNNGPEDYLIALGYAGWGAGQLEEEIRNNSWLSCEGDSSILFNTDISQRWEAAAALIGVDINQLSGDSGHA